MKILELVPVFSDPFGGPVTLVRSISKELAKHHDVTVYTTTALDPMSDFKSHEEICENYKIFYFERNLKSISYSNLFGQINLSYEMLIALKRNLIKFDIVHVHSYRQFPDVLMHYYSKKYGVPFVLQVHGSLCDSASKKNTKRLFDNLIGHRIFESAAKVIALHKVEASQYRSYGVPSNKIAIIPNCMANPEYIISKGRFKDKNNIPNNEKVILYLGRIHESKKIDLLIIAFSHLIKTYNCTDLKLVIAGPDDGYLTYLRYLVVSLGLTASVLFTGFISKEEKFAALMDAEVFVTPSFSGFPMTFLESCAVGTPIITTTSGDELDWIDNNVGFVTKPSPVMLAEAIFTVISDASIRNRLSINCKISMQNNFSVDVVVKRLEQLYQSLLVSSR